MASILNPLGRHAGGFYSGMQKRKESDAATRTEISKLFAEMQKQYPRATRIELEAMLDQLSGGDDWKTAHLRNAPLLDKISSENERQFKAQERKDSFGRIKSRLDLDSTVEETLKRIILSRPSEGPGSTAKGVETSLRKMFGEDAKNLEFSVTDEMMQKFDTQDWVSMQQQVLGLVNEPYYQITAEMISDKFSIPLARAKRMVDHADKQIQDKQKLLEQNQWKEVTEYAVNKAESGYFDKSGINDLMDNIRTRWPNLQWTDAWTKQITGVATQVLEKNKLGLVKQFMAEITAAVSQNMDAFAGQVLQGNTKLGVQIEKIVESIGQYYPEDVRDEVGKSLADSDSPFMRSLFQTVNYAASNAQFIRQEGRNAAAEEAAQAFAASQRGSTRSAMDSRGYTLKDSTAPQEITAIVDQNFRTMSAGGKSEWTAGWDESTGNRIGMNMELAMESIGNSGFVLNENDLGRIAHLWTAPRIKNQITQLSDPGHLENLLKNDAEFQQIVAGKSMADVQAAYGDKFRNQPLKTFPVYIKDWVDYLAQDLSGSEEIFGDITGPNASGSTPEERVARLKYLLTELASFKAQSAAEMKFEKGRQIDFIKVGGPPEESRWDDTLAAETLATSTTAIAALEAKINAQLEIDQAIIAKNATAALSPALLNGTVNFVNYPNTGVPPALDWVQYQNKQKNADLLRDRGGLSALMQLWAEHNIPAGQTIGGGLAPRFKKTWGYTDKLSKTSKDYNAPGVVTPKDKKHVRGVADNFLENTFGYTQGIEDFIHYLNNQPGGKMLLRDLYNQP